MFNPPCEKCIYFVPGKYAHTGSCARYIAYRGRGKLVYDFSDTVRMDTNKCGSKGRFFISKTFKSLMEDDE